MSKASELLNKVSEQISGAMRTSKKLSVKVPSFTFTGEIVVTERGDTSKLLIRKPVSIEIESFKNDIEKVLDKVIVKALVDAVNKAKIISKPVTENKVYVGGHSCETPNSVYVNYK